MAKGSESPSWAWSRGKKECEGCERTLKLAEVACWHTINSEITVWCRECYPTKWGAHMRAVDEKRRAGVAQDQTASGNSD